MDKYEAACLFLLGGGAYLGLEIAWRGTTHWTMFLAGGLCLCCIALFARLPLLLGAAAGAMAVSCIELAFGLVCTRLLHLRVWDYSREWGNIAGLICPKYTLLWFVLCLWVLWVMRSLQAVLR